MCGIHIFRDGGVAFWAVSNSLSQGQEGTGTGHEGHLWDQCSNGRKVGDKAGQRA